jgi:hypothetical protein
MIALMSCSNPVQENPIPESSLTNISQQLETKLYSNPTLIWGSSFGNYFQILCRQNRFDEMVKFTSNESRRKYGDKALRGFYENNFRFDFELGKLKSIQKSGDTSLLVYSNAQILGTKRKVVLKTLIQNDSVKLVLDSLKNPFQFIPR